MVALLVDLPFLRDDVCFSPARTGADHLYSTAALTNSAGGVVERYGYDACGKRVTLNADGSAKSGDAATVVGFTGRTLDSETGLWYFRARYFSEELGRFLGRDEMGYVDGLSLYLPYFLPNQVDPNGNTKECCEEAKAAFEKSAEYLAVVAIITEKKCPPIVLSCVDCNGKDSPCKGSETAACCVGSNVYNCIDSAKNTVGYTVDFHHEIIHAKQNCIGPKYDPDKPCDSEIVRELEAYYESWAKNIGGMAQFPAENETRCFASLTGTSGVIGSVRDNCSGMNDDELLAKIRKIARDLGYDVKCKNAQPQPTPPTTTPPPKPPKQPTTTPPPPPKPPKKPPRK